MRTRPASQSHAYEAREPIRCLYGPQSIQGVHSPQANLAPIYGISKSMQAGGRSRAGSSHSLSNNLTGTWPKSQAGTWFRGDHVTP